MTSTHELRLHKSCAAAKQRFDWDKVSNVPVIPLDDILSILSFVDKIFEQDNDEINWVANDNIKDNIRQRSTVIVNDVGPSEAAVCAGRTHLGRSFMIHVYMSNGRKVLKNKRVYELFQCYRVRDDKIWQIIYHICDGAEGLGFRSSVIIR